MFIRILAFIGFLFGSVFVWVVNFNDLFKMANGQIEETALAFCLKVSSDVGMTWPVLMGIYLWLTPLCLWVACLLTAFTNIGRISHPSS